MIDVHSHLLYGIDDGVQSLDEALEVLLEAKNQGIKEIILTPHYILDGRFHVTKDELEKLMGTLDSDGVQLHLGHELFIHIDLCDHLKSNQCCTLANSKYILVEFPFERYLDDYDYILEDLRSLGYKIIIAHPERYKYVREDVNFCLRWLDEGYLLQCNQNSFIRKETQKLMKQMMNHNFISFIASDTHGKHRPIQLKEVYEMIANKYGKEVADTLFYKNAKAIINNEKIINDSYRPVKGLFGRY